MFLSAKRPLKKAIWRVSGAVLCSAFAIELQAAQETQGGKQGADTKTPGNCSLPPNQKQEAAQSCFADKLVECEKKKQGQPSQGQCLKGVRTCFEEAAGTSKDQSWCGNASDAGKCVEDTGMVKAWAAKDKDDRESEKSLTPRKEGNTWSMQGLPTEATGKDGKQVKIPNPLPTGTVIVYGGTNVAGHIEVMTGDGKVCSDYCSESIRNMQTRDRWIIGVYIPPEGANCKTQGFGGARPQ